MMTNEISNNKTDNISGPVRFIGGPFNGTVQTKAVSELYDNQTINCATRACINGRWVTVDNVYTLTKDSDGLIYKFNGMGIDAGDYNKISRHLDVDILKKISDYLLDSIPYWTAKKAQASDEYDEGIYKGRKIQCQRTSDALDDILNNEEPNTEL